MSSVAIGWHNSCHTHWSQFTMVAFKDRVSYQLTSFPQMWYEVLVWVVQSLQLYCILISCHNNKKLELMIGKRVFPLPVLVVWTLYRHLRSQSMNSLQVGHHNPNWCLRSSTYTRWQPLVGHLIVQPWCNVMSIVPKWSSSFVLLLIKQETSGSDKLCWSIHNTLKVHWAEYLLG